MFAQPTARVVWPILWFFAVPVVALVLWQIATAIVPEPGFPWGIAATVVIFVVAIALPVAVLRRSMQEGHTAGAVLAALCLGWALIVALGLAGMAAFSTDSAPVAVEGGPAPVEARP